MAERKPFLLRVDRELLDAVQRWANDDLRSLNGQIEFLLRQAVANHIIDEVRKAKRRPVGEMPEEPDPAPSPLEQAIGREGFERYEAALQQLKEADREAIIARIELQQSYEEIAIALGKPNANAARMAVTRALTRLVEAMAHQR